MPMIWPEAFTCQHPYFPDEVYLPVLYLLAELAVQRHGQADMTSALARRERMPMTISAF